MPRKRPQTHIARNMPAEVRRHRNLSKTKRKILGLWIKQLKDLEKDKDKMTEKHYNEIRGYIIGELQHYLDNLD